MTPTPTPALDEKESPMPAAEPMSQEIVEWLKERRTHGAYHTEEEALATASNLARLLNGMPMGWSMYLGRRMGAYVLYSQRSGL